MLTIILIILGIAIFMLCIGATLSYVITKKWFSKKNNINDAIILVQHGNEEKPQSGHFKEKHKKGSLYTYGSNEIVIVPNDYPVVFINYRRKIRALANSAMALPLEPLPSNEKQQEDDYEIRKHMMVGHLSSDMVKAMEGKSSINWIIIGIIALILGLVIGFGVSKINSGNSNQTAEVTTTTPTVTSNSPIPTPTPRILPKPSDGVQ